MAFSGELGDSNRTSSRKSHLAESSRGARLHVAPGPLHLLVLASCLLGHVSALVPVEPVGTSRNVHFRRDPSKVEEDIHTTYFLPGDFKKKPKSRSMDRLNLAWTGHITDSPSEPGAVGRTFSNSSDMMLKEVGNPMLPVEYRLGSKKMLFFDRGLVGMVEGERRQLSVPPDLGFGAAGSPENGVPPNSTLLMDVLLVAILDPAENR